ncbi:MAG: ribonuclease III [Microgenomates group bacterium]
MEFWEQFLKELKKQMNLDLLEKNLKIKIKNPQLYQEAFTHRSYLNENKNLSLSSNERLEFLGDSVLSFIISKWLFKTLPQFSEGFLTDLRSNLVKTEALAKIAKKFNLGNYLILSRGEEKGGGRENNSLLANCFEALIGALFLDQGIKITESFIIKNFHPILKEILKNGEIKDPKSIFQEISQAKFKITPSYRLLATSGPDHNKTFTVGVFLKNKKIASGKGKSKQEAEENAAKEALEKLPSKI